MPVNPSRHIVGCDCLGEYDAIVVGGGPGGYPAAIRLSQLNLQVALFEPGPLGGVCTNLGCVPTKALLAYAAGKRGLDGLWAWLGRIVEETRSGVEDLLAHYGVDLFRERVEELYEDNGRVCARTASRTICASRGVVLATGSIPAYPPGLEPDGEQIVGSKELLSGAVGGVPDRMLIVGGGFIGVELGYAFSLLGSQVTLVEMMSSLLPGTDRDLSFEARRALRASGVKVLLNSKVTRITREGRELNVTVENARNGSRTEYKADLVLVATGRRPNPNVGGLEQLGVKFGMRGEVLVDCHMRAGPKIYAAGDVTGEPFLAHKAFLQARIAAENIAGRETCASNTAIPTVVYIRPELVQVGRLEGENIKTVKVRVEALPRARIEGSRGFVKIAYDTRTGRITGLAFAFDHAGEAAGEAAALVALGATIDSAANIVHPHPTLVEAIWEALEAARGSPRHYIV